MEKVVKQKSDKIVGSEWWLKLLVLAVVILLVLDSVQILNMSTVVTRVDKYNQGVVDEIGGFRGDVQSFAGDLNEIRRFLLLPEKNYASAEQDQKQSVDEPQASDNQLGMYAFINQYADSILTEQHRQTERKAWDSLLKNVDFLAKLKSINLSLTVIPGVEMQAKLIDKMEKAVDGTPNQLYNQPIFALVFSPEENVFKMQSVIGDYQISDYELAEFPQKVSEYIASHFSEVSIKKIELKKQTEEQAVQASQALQTAKITQKEDFVKTLTEPAFVESLAGLGLTVASQPKEENNKIIYNVSDQQGHVKFAFALEISSGMIKVIDGNRELNVKNFLEESGLKKKP